jgi:hypothetical protein
VEENDWLSRFSQEKEKMRVKLATVIECVRIIDETAETVKEDFLARIEEAVESGQIAWPGRTCTVEEKLKAIEHWWREEISCPDFPRRRKDD